jgi:predicted Zn-ribbon and HTH transcriptional regulator
MNKRRQGEAVLRGGFMDVEAAARAVNAKPWEPPPGMVKQQCSDCGYFFATDPANTEPRCPDCRS